MPTMRRSNKMERATRINVHLCTNIDCNVEEVYIFQKDE